MIDTIRVLAILGIAGIGVGVLALVWILARMWYNNYVERYKE